MNEETLVSVVIPTRNRPVLLLRAIRSALAQTYSQVEVIVVIDGLDDNTMNALNEINDERLRAIPLPESVGGSEARNTGVRAARGEWIALLDDDDEWYTEKLSRQLAAAAEIKHPGVILSSKYLERSTEESRVFPARLPDLKEAMEDYLCCPRGLRTGGEVLQTSTLLARKSLFMAVPFVPGLKRGQDFMWLIQATTLGGASFHVVPEVLSIFNSEGFTDDRRVSSRPNWRSFYSCVRDNRVLFTPKAYGYCIATRILSDAIKCKEPLSVKMRLLGECLRNGSSSPKCLLVFLYVWVVPPNARIWLGESLRSVKRAGLGNSQVGTA